jgi:hypothetical protein
MVISHFLAFKYFAEEYYAFIEVVGFFFICEWIVPFSLFISLSANDLVLPTLDPNQPDDIGVGNRKTRRSGFLALIDVLSQRLSDFTPSRTSKRF